MKFKKEIGSTFIKQDDYIDIMLGITKREREEDRKEIAILENNKELEEILEEYEAKRTKK